MILERICYLFCVVFISTCLIGIGACARGNTESSDPPNSNDDEPETLSTDNPWIEVLSAILPVVEENYELSSPFGPRLKASEGYRYDFHRGIDIPGTRGDSIFAVADGEIYRVYEEGSASYPEGGHVVVVKHTLPETILFHEQEVTILYSVYMHLDSFGEAAQAYLDSETQSDVKQGDLVGTMGDSGVTDFVHLHFETRLQTTCSLEYQLANPTSSCATYGFDPHVNPVDLFTNDAGSYTLSIVSQSSSDLTVLATATPNTLDVNGINFVLTNPNSGDLIYSQSLDFNLRTSFDATSTATLDDPEVDGFIVSPSAFNTSSTSYDIEFTCNIPASTWDGVDTLAAQVELMDTAGIVKTVETTFAPSP